MRPFVTKQMIDKAKKKLKKLQKRQRKQDVQGVSNTADQWPHELVEKFLAEPREPYTQNMISEEKEKQSTIINTMTIEDFIKWRDKMARLS